jgi:acyl transferase domain-containing protein/NADPH:quinone reductase-like Zn-dependent oxidoreductase/acyl carrier protein
MLPTPISPAEPFAIIGIGCRFPGGAWGPEALWRLLLAGFDGVGEVPADRWDAGQFYHPDRTVPGKACTRRGSFLERIDLFDADFFGISPREAARTSPQHRLLLELTWEALEDAGVPPEHLAGSRTGVFIGASTDEYGERQFKDLTTLNAYSCIGSALSIAANRISYCFDLRGPSLVVDTACSSSLVAAHVACQSLRSGECDLAVLGGINLLLGPERFIGFSAAQMLSPEGRCRAFDAGASGYVRGEGAGVVVLKPLARAVADCDPIYAVIRATGVNQDGRTPGLASPNEAAQEALLRAVCSSAGVAPHSVQYVEAHGTGTPIGDPIECAALGRALGAGRAPDNCLLIGSVKTNIGHLEAASGIAGLIKVALALHHGRVPASLHFQAPSPDIDFTGLRLRVPTEAEPWPGGQAGALAGINSFGFGGTNAHVVLQHYPSAPPAAAPAAERAYLFPLSARSPRALEALAAACQDWLREAPHLSLGDRCYSASLRRSHHEHRLALTAATNEQLAERLGTFLAGERGRGIATSRARSGPRPRIAFLFSGNGPQWWAMGRRLLEEEAVFREGVQACDRLWQQYAPWSLWQELHCDEASSRMDRTLVAQPTLFALQVGLVELWRAWGLQPDAVAGHSVGEVAAAYAAGALTLESAVQVIYHRSRTQEQTAGTGKMAAAELDAEQAKKAIAGYGGRLCIAAYNAPTSVTLSGDSDALDELAQSLAQRNFYCRPLRLQYAFHSQHMDAIQQELLASLAPLRPLPASLPFVSTVFGDWIGDRKCDASYWWDNIRQPVRFGDAVERLLDWGCTIFVEIGPHPVLASYVAEATAVRGAEALVLPSLRRQEDDRSTLLSSLGGLYTAGYPVDWGRLHPDGGRFVRLPAYPWQREAHWHLPEEHTLLSGREAHPLLGQRVESGQVHWHLRFEPHALAYLADHRVQTAVVFPSTGFLEMALAAAVQVIGGPSQVEDVEVLEPLVLEGGSPDALELVVESDRTFSINSRSDRKAAEWRVHYRGKIAGGPRPEAAPKWSLEQVRQRCSTELSREEVYRGFELRNLPYGPAFRGLERIWVGQGEAMGEVRAPEVLTAELGHYHMHPAVLDACCQAFLPLFPSNNDLAERTTWLPTRVGRYRVLRRPGDHLFVHARRLKVGDGWLLAEYTVLSPEGLVVAELHSATCRAINFSQDQARAPWSDYLYEQVWQPQPLPDTELAVLATSLPGPYQLADELRPEVARWATDLLADRYYEDFEPKFTKLAAAYLAPIENGQSNCYSLAATSPDELWRELAATQSAFSAELLLMGACGRQLERPPPEGWSSLPLLPESSAVLEHLYESAPSSRLSNRLLQEVIAGAARSLPAGRRLRVLEIGGGTGGATSHILTSLPPGRAQYRFTDRSALWVSNAERKFHNFRDLECSTLDITRSPASQGLTPHSFDVVVAANVLHEVPDLRQALGHIQELLASEGLLVLSEWTRRTPFLDLLGLCSGWWRLTDTDLRNSPLLTPERWATLLESAGLGEVTVLADRPSEKEPLQAVVLARGPRLARAPAAEPAPLIAGTWALFTDRGDVADGLACRMTDGGARTILVRQGAAFSRPAPDVYTVSPTSPEDIAALVEALHTEEAPLTGVVHCWGLDGVLPPTAPAATLYAAMSAECLSVLYLTQALARCSGGLLPRLWLVTRGAQYLGPSDGPVSMAQVPLWGLGRVILREHPGLRCTLVDLGPTAGEPTGDVHLLEAELLADNQEEEVLWHQGSRYVHRLTRAPLTAADLSTTASVLRPGESFRLEARSAGSQDGPTFQAIRRCQPGPGEVEVEVEAAGMNFKDVLQAMGVLSGEALEQGHAGGLVLGLECAGRVVAVGAGALEWQVGDAVLGLARHCFAGHVVTRAELLAARPAHLSAAEAATIPIAFCTAYHALCDIARLQAGERVLIHSAAGGVGLAAVQIVQMCGGEVFATAGSPEKQDLLRLLGVRHIFDSRSLAFADEVRTATQGEGVDIVLNSLAGEAIPKGLSVLRPFGRFLEIGKRDLLENSRLGLRPFEKCLAFHTIDLDQLLLHAPRQVSSLLREVVKLFQTRALHPLLHREFPIHRIGDALRHMQQARHIGKVVVSRTDHPPPRTVRPPTTSAIREGATYLIVGGLSGFGLATAQWMVEKGARHLVLAGRTGASTPEANAAVAALRQAGAQVLVRRMDATRPEDVAAVLTEVQQSLPPLRGVIYSALVMDDGILLHLTAERFDKVAQPKVLGSWNLHLATRDLPLDFFVCYSSLTSLLGIGGQGSYAAANLFLDMLAFHRRASGLPGLAINWGPLADVGWLARHPAVNERVLGQGARALSAAEALEVLGRLLLTERAQVGVVDIDWQRWSSGPGALSPRLERLEGAAVRPDQHLAATNLRDALRGAAPEVQSELVQRHIREQVAGVLGSTAARVDIDKPLTALGLDSLMAVELQARIQHSAGVNVPVMALLHRRSVADLTRLLCDRLADNGSAQAQARGG